MCALIEQANIEAGDATTKRDDCEDTIDETGFLADESKSPIAPSRATGDCVGPLAIVVFTECGMAIQVLFRTQYKGAR